MKKYLLLITFICSLIFISSFAFAFSDVGTHPDITKAAVVQSMLVGDYLKNNLGFKNGKDELVDNDPTNLRKKISIQQVIMDGARTEDSGTLPPTLGCSRGLNHFYDPTDGKGLSEWVNFSTLPIPIVGDLIWWHYLGNANPEWGLGVCESCDPTDSMKIDPNKTE